MTEPTLASLREAGAHHLDPVHFHYLEVLAQRLTSQPEAVQQRLAQTLKVALDQYAQRAAQAPSGQGALPEAHATTPPWASGHAAPLTRLNRYIQERTQAAASQADTGEGGSPSDMNSVRRFSEVWSKIAAEQQVVQAVDRGPENAGPLNSHRLMLRSLTLMRSLSPDYLGRFLAQMEALLWLDQVNQQTTLKDGKPKRPSRAKK